MGKRYTNEEYISSKNKIPLLKIPYWDINNVEDLISNFLGF